jgi:hypothetical protein
MRSFVPIVVLSVVAMLPTVVVFAVFPIVTAPVDVPVLILVAKFELALMLVAAPLMVAPAVPVIRPELVIVPV